MNTALFWEFQCRFGVPASNEASRGFVFGVLGSLGVHLRVIVGHSGIWGGKEGGSGGSKRGPGGDPLFPLSSIVCPSESLVRQRILCQTPHDSQTG